jgi:hypothetical protein
MKKTKKLYLCIEKYSYVDDNGKEHETIQKYIGTINSLNKDRYFEGAWFDENNSMAGSVELSKDDFKKTIISFRELKIE